MARYFFRLSSNKDTRDILKNTRIGSYFYQSFNYILSNVNSSQAPSENKNSLEKSKQQIERKSNVLADSVHNVEKSFPEMRGQQDRRKSNDLVVESVREAFKKNNDETYGKFHILGGGVSRG